MPCVTSLDALNRAAAEFTVTGPGLVIEPPALVAARRSLDSAGARLAGQRPGVREIRISYGGGGFYNGGPRQFARLADPQDKIRLYQHDGELVLDLPLATEAVVPHRPQP